MCIWQIEINDLIIVIYKHNSVSIHSIKLTLQSMRLSDIFLQIWVDEQLVWDPLDHGGIERVSISTEDIWIPDLTVPERFEIIKLSQYNSS